VVFSPPAAIGVSPPCYSRCGFFYFVVQYSLHPISEKYLTLAPGKAFFNALYLTFKFYNYV